jgi:branched-subunit amino acid transport protein
MNALVDLSPYALLILVGFLPNEVWRMLGLVLSRGIEEDSEIIVWVRAVATAIMTGVVGKLILFAPGALAQVPLWVRIGAAALALAAFMLLRKSVMAAVIVGPCAIALGMLLFGG